MANSLLDLQLLAILKHSTDGIAAYLDNAAAFAELFDDINPTTLEKWRNELRQPPPEAPKLKPVVFKRNWSAGIPEHARIVMVRPPSEREIEGYLGNKMGTIEDGDGRRELVGSTVEQSVEIMVMTLREHLTDALKVVVHAVLVRAKATLEGLGYASMRYGSTSELSPVTQMIAEDLGVFTHQLRFTANRDVAIPLQLPGQPINYKPFAVQLDNVEPDPERDPAPGAGTPGGVAPLL